MLPRVDAVMDERSWRKVLLKLYFSKCISQSISQNVLKMFSKCISQNVAKNVDAVMDERSWRSVLSFNLDEQWREVKVQNFS